jgi:sulfotransferase family protein
MTASANAPVSADTPHGRVPDFFIVGHPKSGTSALFQMLQSYPQLHMPRKEPSYFVPEVRSRRSKRYSRGISEYVSLFAEAAPEQLIGEATTSYLWSQTAAGLIAEAQPGARIVAILREPADFLRSLHLQFVRSHVETEQNFRNALALDGPRREGRQIPRNSTRPRQLVYSDHVDYVEQLKRYHAVFPSEQVLVLIYEDFRADNAATVRQVLRFLNVDDAPPEQLIEANPAAAVRSPRMYDLVRSLYLGRAPAARTVKKSVKALTSQRMRHETMATMRRAQRREPPPPDSALMDELRRRYKGEVEALSDYLGRDLITYWHYDRLD